MKKIIKIIKGKTMKKKFVATLTAFMFLCSQTGFADVATNITAIAGKGTTVSGTGTNTINVNTTNIHDKTGFNSFSQFDVNSADTVNLNLTADISNLVNLVDGPVSQIYGKVNSLMSDGKIGGNVFFLNSNGIVIGKTGVFNVGALTLATPSADYIKNIINNDQYSGFNSGNFANAVRSGDVPINPSGNISIKGKVNAYYGVDVTAGKVEVGDGTANSGIINTIGSVDASYITNMDGTPVTEIKEKEGKIIIQAKEIKVNDNAKISSKKQGADKAGNIDIEASDITENIISVEANKTNASIEIGNAEISGNDISITAFAKNTADKDNKDFNYDLGDPDDLIELGLNSMTSVVDAIVEAVDGATDVSIAESNINASISIADGAKITAENDVNVKTSVDSYITVKSEDENIALSVGANVLQSKIDIGNAQIKAGNDANIKAYSYINNDIEAKSISNNSDIQGAFGISIVESDTSVSIAEGATITGKNVYVDALTEKDIKVTTKVEKSTNTNFGLGVAIDYSNMENKVEMLGNATAANNVSINSNVYDALNPEALVKNKNEGGEVIIGNGTSASAIKGNSITVTAKDITINDKSSLTTAAAGSDPKGNILISASDNGKSLVNTKSASVTIGDANINGNNVTIEANASNTYDYDKVDGRDKIKVGSLTDTLIGVGQNVLDVINDVTDDAVKGVIAKSDVTAKIDIKDGAAIEADENLKIASNAVSKTALETNAKGLGVGVAVNLSESAVNIGNAELKAVNNVNISAGSEVTSSLDAKAASYDIEGAVELGGSVGVAVIDSKTSVDIGAGSQITAKDINVSASTEKDLSMKVETKAGEKASAGLAVGVNISNSENTVTAKGKMIAANDINIDSSILSKNNSQKISSSTGNKPKEEGGGTPDPNEEEPAEYTGTSFNTDKLQTKTNKEADDTNKNSGMEKDKNGNKISIAGSVLYSDHSNTATAEVSGTTAELEAGNDINIKAAVTDENIKQFVDAAVSASSGTTVSGTGAIVIADYTNNATAFVDGASIDAGKNINVKSDFLMPFGGYDWFAVFANFFNDPDFDSGKAVFDTLSGGTDGLKDAVVNSWVRSSTAKSNADPKEGEPSPSPEPNPEDPPGSDSDGKTGSSFSVDVSGAVNLTDYNYTSKAYIKNAKVNKKDDSSATPPVFRTGEQAVNVEANSKTTSITVGGVFGKDYKNPMGQSGSDVGVGGTYNQVRYNTETSATIEGDTELYANDLNINANNDQLDVTVGIAGGESASFGLQGVFNWIEADNTVNAGIFKGEGNPLKSNIDIVAGNITDGGIKIAANDTPIIVNVAGSLSRSETAAVGVSAAVTDIDRKTNAAIENAVVNTEKKSSLYALNDGLIHSYAIAAAVATKKAPKEEPDRDQTSDPNASNMADKDKGTSNGTGDSGGFGLGISGSAGISNITGEASAYVKNTEYTGEEDLDIKAREESDIINGAGGVSIVANGGSTGVGVAGAGSISWVSNNAKAFIENSTVENDENINITAESDAGIVSVAAGLAGSTASKGATIAGSGTVNITDNSTEAYIVGSDVISDKDIKISAADDSSIHSIAGAVSATVGAVGFGAAVGVNILGNNTSSHILNSDVTSKGLLDLNAANTSNIFAVAGAVGIAKGAVGLAVTVIVNVISNSTKAYIEGKKTNGLEAVNASLNAKDGSDIFGVAGVAGIGNKVGIGIGAGVNTLSNEASAYIKDSELEIEENINVKALVESEIELAIAALGGAGTVGIAGSAGVGTVGNSAHAYIENSVIEAGGSVGVFAESENIINLYSGAVGIGGTVGIGGNIGLNLISNKAIAEVKKDSIITAKGKTGWISEGEWIDGLSGLIVNTNMQDVVSVFNFAAGGGGTVGISAGVTGAIVNNHSIAKIINSDVNTDLNDLNINDYFEGQSVYVRADNETDIASYGGQLSVAGTASVAGVADFLVMNNAVSAGIADSAVKARGDVEVKTNNVEKYGAKIVAGSLGVSGAGVAANVAAAITDTKNNAYISDSEIYAGNNVNVKAEDTIIIGHDRYNVMKAIFGEEEDSPYLGVTLGAVAGGLYAGVAGAVFVSVLSNSVKANITDSKVTAANKLSVDAESSQKMRSTTSVGGFGAAGVAISGTVNVVNTETEALIKIKETSGKTTEVQAKDIAVNASNSMEVDKKFVGIAGGGAGVTAGVAVSVLNNNVLAGIGTGVKADASNDISVTADNSREISEFVAALASASVGINGAVSVNVIGSNVTPDDSDSDENVNNYLDNDFKATMTSSLNRGSDYNDENVGRGGLIDLSKSQDNLNVGDDFNTIFSAADPKNVGTQAYIGSGAQVTAGNDININATDTTSIKNVVGQMAVGGIVSVNASVGIADLKTSAKAYVDSSAELSAGNNINITSDAKIGGEDENDEDGSYLNIYMGAVSNGLAAVNAAVSVFNFTNDSLAYIADGANIKKAKDVNITANSSSKFKNEIFNAAISEGFSGGAVVSVINKDGNTKAYTGNNVSVGDDSVDSVNINANTDNNIQAATVSAAGGIGAANVNVFSVNVTDKLSAYTGTGNIFNLKNALSVLTNGNSNINAKYAGISAGAVSVSASVAVVDLILDNNAYLGSSNNVIAEDISVIANQQEASVKSSAQASTAGALVSANGIGIDNDVAGIVKASVGKNSSLAASDTINIMSNSKQLLNAVGDSLIAGYIALGVTYADNTASISTITELEDGVSIGANNLNLNAYSDVNMLITASSGQGGVAVIGGAGVTNTNNSFTNVLLGKTTGNGLLDIKANNLNMFANAKASLNSYISSTSIGIGTAGVFFSENKSDSDVAVDIDGKTTISANKISVKAKNEFNKENADKKNNVDSAALSAIGVFVARSETDIDNTTEVIFGKDSDISAYAIKDDITGDTESSFLVDAHNVINAHDYSKYTAAAVGQGANLKSEILNDSKTEILFKGKVLSAKDIVANSRTDQNTITNAHLVLASAVGVAVAESINNANIDNKITLESGANMFANGNVILNLSQDENGNRSAYRQTAMADVYNMALIPIDGSYAHVKLTDNNDVHIMSDASLKSAGNITVNHFDSFDSTYGLLNVYTPYGQFATKDETSKEEVTHNSSVKVDGTMRAGANNKINIVINENKTISITLMVDGVERTAVTTLEDVTMGNPITVSFGDGLEYTLSEEDLATNLFKELAELEALHEAYYQDTALRAAYQADIDRVYRDLEALGLREFTESASGTSGYVTGTKSLDYITFGDINANRGDIKIFAKSLYGTGQLIAPGNAEVKIENNSNLYLRINDIKISDLSHGDILFNGVYVKNNAEINANNDGKTASFSLINSAEGSGQDPEISIKSTHYYEGPREKLDENGVGTGEFVNVKEAPWVDMVGNIENKNGTVSINSASDINTKGNILAKTISITSLYGNIVQSFFNGIFHVGGDPSQFAESGKNNGAFGNTQSKIVANNVFLNARYLNLNGLVQAGVADLYINIADNKLNLVGVGYDPTDGSVALAKAHYAENKGNPLYLLKDTYGNIRAEYNVLTDQIVLADVYASGGRLEIVGSILNTGKDIGELRVLDGYARVNIVNNSDFELNVNNIVNEVASKGYIKITDTSKQNAKGESLSTIYEMQNGQMTVTERYGTAGAVVSLTNLGNVRETAYSPVSGTRYKWMTGKEYMTKETWTFSSKEFWGIDFDENMNWTKGQPIFLGDIDLKNGSAVLTSGGIGYYNSNTVRHDTTGKVAVSGVDDNGDVIIKKKSHGLPPILGYYSYHAEIKWEDGYKNITTHDVKADNPVKINFIGYDTPQTDINSKNNILLSGNILTTGGDVNITSREGQINTGGNAVISGKNITLNADKGIADNLEGNSVIVMNHDALNAVTRSGNINISGRGSLNIGQVSASDGNVTLSAEEDIIAKLKIKGERIDLTANRGRIGGNNEGDALILEGNIVKANANNNINLKKSMAGNLGIDTIVSRAGDVSVEVAGNIYDANKTTFADPRTDAELIDLWNSLDLMTEFELLDENGEKTGQTLKAWSEQQLLNAMNTNFDNPSGGSQAGRVEESNITANKVNIKAGGSIGTNEDSFSFNIKDDINSLSYDQRQMLANAESRNIEKFGDIITIYKKDDLNLNARGEINAESGSHMYLGSDEDMHIGKIKAGAEINIKSIKNIYNAADGNTANITGDNVTLESETGNIGKIDKIFKVNATGALTARAKENIFITSDNNLALKYLTAGQNILIDTSNDVMNVHDGENDVNITAKNITIKARNIGSSLKNLNLGMWGDSSKTIVDMTATGSLYINNVYDSPIYNKDLYFSNLTAAEYVVVNTKKGSILKYDDNSLITAKNIKLNALNGNLGTSDSKILVSASDSVSGAAKDNIYLTSDESVSYENVNSAEGVIDLFSKENLYADNINAFENINILSEKALDVGIKGISSSEGAITLTGGKEVKLDGKVEAKDNIAIEAAENLIQNADIKSEKGTVVANVEKEIEINADVTAGDDISFKGNDIITVKGNLLSTDGAIGLAAGGNITTNGSLSAKDDIVFDGGNEILVSGNVDSSAGSIDMTSASKTDINGALTAFNNIGIDVADKALTINGETRALNGNINFNISASDLFVNNIVAGKGTVYADVYGSIIDDASSLTAGIYANEVDLNARTGNIGSKQNHFRIDNEAASPVIVTATAENGGVYIDGFANGAKIKLIKCAEDIILIADNTIEGVFMGEKVANLVAKNITMHSLNGSVGTEKNRIIVAPLFMKGKVNLSAATGMYLDQYVHICYSDYVRNNKNGTVSLILPDSHAAITEVSVSGKTDVNIEFLSNKHVKEVSLTYNDIKKLIVHPTAVLHPSLKPAPQHKLDLLEDFEDNVSVDGDLFASSK